MLHAGVDHSTVIGFTSAGVLKTFKAGTHSACLSFCEDNNWHFEADGERIDITLVDSGNPFFA